MGINNKFIFVSSICVGLISICSCSEEGLSESNEVLPAEAFLSHIEVSRDTIDGMELMTASMYLSSCDTSINRDNNRYKSGIAFDSIEVRLIQSKLKNSDKCLNVQNVFEYYISKPRAISTYDFLALLGSIGNDDFIVRFGDKKMIVHTDSTFLIMEDLKYH